MPKRIGYQAKSQRPPTFIRQWREFRGLTQDELAARLETSSASVSRIESGAQPYTQDFLEACAGALQTVPTSLLVRSPLDQEAIGTRPQRGRTYIKEWRKYRGMTLEAAAERAGMTAGNISAMERDTQGYTQAGLEALATAYDAKPGWLLDVDPTRSEQARSNHDNTSFAGPKRPLRIYLAEWREQKGLTQQQLADRLGTSSVTISRWEIGSRRPDLDAQAAVSEALDIEPVDLLRHPSEPSTDSLLRDQPPDVVAMALKLIQAIRR